MSARGLGANYQGMKWCWPPTRWAIYWRDRDPYTGKLRCVWCLRSGPGVRLTLDHLDPWVRGGSNSPTNLVTSCVPCNSRRGAESYAQWQASGRYSLEVHARVETVRYLPVDRVVGKILYAAHRGAQPTKPTVLCYTRDFDDSRVLAAQRLERIAAGLEDPPPDVWLDGEDYIPPPEVPF